MLLLRFDRPLRPGLVTFVVLLVALVTATTMIRRGEQHQLQERMLIS